MVHVIEAGMNNYQKIMLAQNMLFAPANTYKDINNNNSCEPSTMNFQFYNEFMCESYQHMTMLFGIAIRRLNQFSVNGMVKYATPYYEWSIHTREFAKKYLSIYKNSFQLVVTGPSSAAEFDSLGLSMQTQQKQFREKYQRLFKSQLR